MSTLAAGPAIARSGRIMLLGDESFYKDYVEGKSAVFADIVPEVLQGSDSVGVILETRRDARDPEVLDIASASQTLCFPEDYIDRLRNTPLSETITQAYESGALILASGGGASMMGSWALKVPTPVPGIGLLPKTVVDSQSRLEQLLMKTPSGSVGIALASDSVAVIENQSLSVQGKGPVMVLETGGVLDANSALMHILFSGDTCEPSVPDERPRPPVYRAGKPFLIAIGSENPIDLPGVRDFVRASGGAGAMPLLLVSEKMLPVAREWRIQLLRYGARRVVILPSSELSDARLSPALQGATGIVLLDDAANTLRDALLAENERYALYVREYGDRLPVMAPAGGRILGAGGLNLLPAVVCESLEVPAGFSNLLRAQMVDRSLGFALTASASVTFNHSQALVTGKAPVLCLESESADFRPMGEGLPAVTGLLLHALPPKGAFDMVRRKPRS